MDLKKELLPAKYPGVRVIYGDSVAGTRRCSCATTAAWW